MTRATAHVALETTIPKRTDRRYWTHGPDTDPVESWRAAADPARFAAGRWRRGRSRPAHSRQFTPDIHHRHFRTDVREHHDLRGSGHRDGRAARAPQRLGKN